MTNASAIETALQRASRIAGSDSALARLIGKHQTTVSDRVRNGREVWAEDVLTIERETGISRHELRPDLYPREDPPAHPSAGIQPPLADGAPSRSERCA